MVPLRNKIRCGKHFGACVVALDTLENQTDSSCPKTKHVCPTLSALLGARNELDKQLMFLGWLVVVLLKSGNQIGFDWVFSKTVEHKSTA